MHRDSLNLSCSGMWLRGMVGNCVAAAPATFVKMIHFLLCAWMKEWVPGHPVCK